MKYFWLPLFFLFPFLNYGQQYDKYWVEFTDKKNTPYSIHRPTEFLSPRAIQRRQNQGIAIEENDLPVSPEYIWKIRDLGAKIDYTSRWFNAASVYADSLTYTRLVKLPFVKFSEPVGRRNSPGLRKHGETKRTEQTNDYPKLPEYYGLGENQIRMLKGDVLHKMGFDGDGMLVAVLDGGFSKVDVMPFFDSLRADGRLLIGWDFVQGDDFVYEGSSHGSHVLSTMAANLPGLLVGTAPGASYVCIKTEDVGSELRVEEDNWVAGIELADSLGVDVLNSSLGYTRFDDKKMNYSYKDMNGEVARITRAADIGASKGMLVVNSAGNAGGGDWKYIGAPADGFNVLAVGAVNAYNNKVYFSSFGPSSDGRIKPNVAAKGGRTSVGSLYGYQVEGADGTSFASPVMAGMAASLWQAFPDKTNMEIFEALELSGSRANAPDADLGYGIPDFYKAYLLLSENSLHLGGQSSGSSAPNSFNDELLLSYWSAEGGEAKIQVYNVLGKEVYTGQEQATRKSFNQFKLSLNDLPAGLYWLAISDGEAVHYEKFVKEDLK